MDIKTVTASQLSLMKAAMGWTAAGGNFRPPQPLNGRTVFGCDEVDQYPYLAFGWKSYLGAVAGTNDLCSDGDTQSPIDLPQCIAGGVKTDNPVQVLWKNDATLKLNNDGNTLSFTVDGDDSQTHMSEDADTD